MASTLRIALYLAPNNLKVSFTEPLARTNQPPSSVERRKTAPLDIKQGFCFCVEQKGRKRRKLKKGKEKSLCERNLHFKTLFLISMAMSAHGYVLRIRYVYLS
jgi:hypothetical protein